MEGFILPASLSSLLLSKYPLLLMLPTSSIPGSLLLTTLPTNHKQTKGNNRLILLQQSCSAPPFNCLSLSRGNFGPSYRQLKGVVDPNRTVFSVEWFDFLRKELVTSKALMGSLLSQPFFLVPIPNKEKGIFVLKSVVIPTLQWILPDHCSQLGFQEPCSFGGILEIYSFLRNGLIQLFYVLWFYPLYVFSFILSSIWYNDIAKYGFAVVGRHERSVPEPSTQKGTIQNSAHIDKRSGLGGILIGIGEQVYSVLLLSFFFLEVYTIGFIPYIGKALNFLLLSWMYAYYCFEYKWNFSELGLDKRLDFFESNWAFFAGFGSPCVLAIFFFSPLVSYGVMAILFPLFVLIAMSSEAEQVIDSQRRKWAGSELGRLPIFYAADALLLCLLSRNLWNLENKHKAMDHSKKS